MTLIKIDLNSIKQNPDAGRTRYDILGNITAQVSFTLPKDVVLLPFVNKIQGFKILKWESGDTKIKVSGIFCNVDAQLLLDRLEVVGVKRNSISFQIDNHVETVHSIVPESKYHYSYLDTEVQCEECEVHFSHTALGESDYYDDSAEYYASNVCPNCGQDECCSVEWETLEEARERAKEL